MSIKLLWNDPSARFHGRGAYYKTAGTIQIANGRPQKQTATAQSNARWTPVKEILANLSLPLLCFVNGRCYRTPTFVPAGSFVDRVARSDPGISPLRHAVSRYWLWSQSCCKWKCSTFWLELKEALGRPLLDGLSHHPLTADTAQEQIPDWAKVMI